MFHRNRDLRPGISLSLMGLPWNQKKMQLVRISAGLPWSSRRERYTMRECNEGISIDYAERTSDCFPEE